MAALQEQPERLCDSDRRSAPVRRRADPWWVLKAVTLPESEHNTSMPSQTPKASTNRSFCPANMLPSKLPGGQGPAHSRCAGVGHAVSFGPAAVSLLTGILRRVLRLGGSGRARPRLQVCCSSHEVNTTWHLWWCWGLRAAKPVLPWDVFLEATGGLTVLRLVCSRPLRMMTLARCWGHGNVGSSQSTAQTARNRRLVLTQPLVASWHAL